MINPPPSEPTPITLSFEFFPPKGDTGLTQLDQSLRRLSGLKPIFVSVTCGAGGSAIEGTADAIGYIQNTFKLDAVPHIAFARQTRARLREVLQNYKKAGVTRIVAIRGDVAAGPDAQIVEDPYPNTVDFVADMKSAFGLDPIVAAYPDVHPLALSPQQDLDHLKRKIEAGASLAISQFFFEAETFLRFRDLLHKAGISVPLAPGVMPINNIAQVIRFAEGCGTKVPHGFAARFAKAGADEDALFKEGVAHALTLCETLRSEGCGHFHFYTLNRAKMIHAICEGLGLRAVP